ncbi:MAG: hypothetical protein H0U76_08020 [Ktedonobacteraceae bacterium]|nr:hypothetical protein [Ktedonobacteraceae bacterium]
MKISRIWLLVLVMAIAAAHVVVGAMWLQVFAGVDPDGSSTVAFLYSPLSALSGIAMPFLLGYLTRQGFLFGAFVGLIAGPIDLLLIAHQWPSLGLAPQLVSSALGVPLPAQ